MIYFDDNAISVPDKEVVNTVMNIYNNQFYNPNSIYNPGLDSKRMWLCSKEIIANEIGCNASELTICSGASEANNTALLGYIRANNKYHFITSFTEHSSITENPYARMLIRIDKDGFYNIDDISKIHDKLVCISMASSEIGVIQDVKNIVEILHSHRNIVHIDATACFLKEKININDIKPDMLCATAQKVHGVLGAAFLYVNPNIKIEPLIYGHGIEPLRAGTPNLPALCGLAKAIQIHNWNDNKKIKEMRDYFIDRLLEIHGVVLNGSRDKRLCNNVNVHIDGIELDNQQLLAMVDLYGYAVSSSSACNSGSKSPSSTLLALGLTEEQANRSLRITLSKYNTIEEINKFINDFKNIIEQFK